MAPSQDASDHQDYYIFSRESQKKNLYLPLESWEGATPNIEPLKKRNDLHCFRGLFPWGLVAGYDLLENLNNHYSCFGRDTPWKMNGGFTWEYGPPQKGNSSEPNHHDFRFDSFIFVGQNLFNRQGEWVKIGGFWPHPVAHIACPATPPIRSWVLRVLRDRKWWARRLPGS